MRRYKSELVKIVTVLLLVLLVIIGYTIYLNDLCDFQDGLTAVRTPDGRQIEKFKPGEAVKTFSSLPAICDYRNGKLVCPDVRNLGETMLRQTQLATIRMLAAFDKICRKHGIRYWMWRGALLGVIRHEGFIPWDNELDIGIMKADYEKFRIVSHELPPDIFLQNASSDPEYGRQKHAILGKLRDTRGCFGYCARTGCHFHDGLMIDIFGFEEYRDGFIRETTSNSVNFEIRKRNIFPLKEKTFEGFQVMVPLDHDTLLTKTYGSDYGELPPIKRRCPPGKLIGLPWTSCQDLEQMDTKQKRLHLYLSTISNIKYLAWFF